MDASTLETIAGLLRDARSMLFITGAGISADSGLPTYRGVGGLYNEDTEDGVAIEDALSGAMFSVRPELTWKYMWQIGMACRGARPNSAHAVIAEQMWYMMKEGCTFDEGRYLAELRKIVESYR